ncbi:AzlC family ABC transporter permease [Nonomuraea sp. NPDC050556]|uniref:AzlC family ABC transporter permease n=1 Tax=Nonomuraea sp. NPDC050556 TaxID=3364369 RepID=UPI0037B6F98E
MATRAAILRTAAVVGVSTGLYGTAFGALASSAGLSVLQATVMSLLVFTGGSQFVAVGVLSGGGSPATALGAAWLLGARNAFYGLRIAPVIGDGALRRLLAAQWTVDESTAVASAQPTRSAAALGFWSTGLAARR